MSSPGLAAPAPPPGPALHPLLARPEQERWLGPYRLLRQLGRGGFAPVWLAEEAHDGKRLRDVAIKLFFLPDTIASASAEAIAWREGVLEEARALCRVEHPNVVRFYALQRDDPSGVVGLVMEHVAGVSLDVRLEREGPLDEGTVIEIGIGVAWALAAVHDAGLVHRDVKPGNVIQGANGYKLIDFGIVVDTREQAPDEGGGNASVLVGTHGYMAPERFALGAPSTPSSDLFGLGATLFKLARGALPPALSPATERPALARSPRDLAELTAMLLDPIPDRRPRHAEWVARDLERLRAQRGAPSGAPGGYSPRLRGFRSSNEETSATAAPISVVYGEDVPTRTDANLEDRSAPAELCQHPPLVGRDDALAALARAAREAAAGAVRLVVLSGPLGIGRTRLLDAAIERASSIRRVLRARCSPERPSQLRPLLRALDALSDADARGLDLVRDAIERAVQPGALPSPDEASQALEAVEDALVWASAEEPILWAIDDIQWADARTLALLRLLVERTEATSRGKLLVVATARDEPNPSAPLRALLRQVRARLPARAGVIAIALHPLTADETAALARAVSPLAPEVEVAVVRGSGRVPFFVVHALLGWREAGAIEWREGAWRAAGERPLCEDVPGVAELLEARLASCLDPESEPAALRVLAAIALHGEALDSETLLRIVAAGESERQPGSSAEAALRALEALVDAGILTIAGELQEYGFAQEMVRQAVRNLVRRRPWFCRLHRALLDTLADGPTAAADASFLATGYEKLGAREPARLWLGRAMEAAALAGLFEEAVEAGDRLVALTPDLAQRAAVELTIVRALVRGRRFEQAKQRLARVVILSGAAGGAAELRGRIYRLEAARGLCEADPGDATLVADADALGDPTLSCEARMAVAGVCPEESALRLASEAVELSPRGGVALEFAARVLRFELTYASNRRDLVQAEADLSRALAIATATASTWQQLHIEADLAVVEAELGRVGAAVDRLRRLSARLEAVGMRAELRLVLQNLSAFLLREGRVAEAAETAKRTADLATEAGDPALRATSLSLRAEALRRAGDLGAALDCANEAERVQQGRRDRSSPLTLLRRAEILDALGRTDAALEDARRARILADQLEDRDLAISAVLWVNLRLARRGELGREAVEQALAEAEAAGVTLRALTKSLMAQTKEWLAGATTVDT